MPIAFTYIAATNSILIDVKDRIYYAHTDLTPLPSYLQTPGLCRLTRLRHSTSTLALESGDMQVPNGLQVKRLAPELG